MASGTPALGNAPRLEYNAALDGVRGLAVLAVLAFHAGFSWAVGGYLGVSTFFTLSGFLITSLLLTERETTGSVDRRRFWARRLRRLMPASLLTLGLAVLYGSGLLAVVDFAASDAQLQTLRGDVLSALFYVANWRFILDTQSYADLFSAPSPVLQFWSLAIEEQFYLLFPLLAIGVLGATRGSRRGFATVLAVLTAGSLASSLMLGYSQDRIYFGTDTRAAELLIGALLAVAVARRPVATDGRSAALVSTVGVLALAVTVVIWSQVGQGSAWLYEGGFTLYALLTAGVLLAATQPSGPVRALLSWRPIVQLGRISYGVYLFHWLVFLWLRNLGASDLTVFVVGGAITLAVALASFHWLEAPIREARALTSRQAWIVAPAAAAVVVAMLLVVTASPPAAIDFAGAQEQLRAASVPYDAAAAEAHAADMAEPPPPRISVFGDSTALMTGLGLSTWMRETGEAIPAGGDAELGCSLARGGERRTTDGGSEVNPGVCDLWETRWAEAVARDRPDLAVLQVGVWEVADRRLPGDDRWRVPGDPVYDDYLRSELERAVDVLSAGGATVALLTNPPVGPGASGSEAARRGAAADPARMARLNQLLAEVAASKPDQAALVDLERYLAEQDDARLRPDGVHFSLATATEVAADYLGPELVSVFDERWAPVGVNE